MKNYRKLWILIFLILITSCGGTIEIVNNTNSQAYLEKQIDYIDGDSNTTRYEIQPRGGIILTGYKSNWTRNSLNKFCSDISTLRLISIADTIILTNQSDIVEYLIDHRKGIFNQNIMLEIGEKD